MTVLNSQLKSQVENLLEGLTRPVLMRLHIRETDCETSHETRRLVEELAQVSERLHTEVVNLQDGEDRAPTLTLLAQDGSGRWIDYGVAFYGIPSGYEFTSLVNGLLLVSQGESGLSQATRDALAALPQDVEIQVFVTPTCPYCPRAVVLAHQMAVESPRLRAAMVEATEFPQEVGRHGISGVPHSVINDVVHVVGAVPEQHLLAQVRRAVGLPVAFGQPQAAH